MTKRIYAPGLNILLSAICLASSASARTSWRKVYGGPLMDAGYSAEQTTDSGYIIVGVATDASWNTDVYLVKTNASGDTLWTRTYGGPNYDEGYSVHQTADGGYFVAGATQSAVTDTEDVYLIKTDSSGDTLWTKTYCGPAADEANAAGVTADGGYIIAGITRGYGTDSGKVYILKTNVSGDTIWTRTDGGPGYNEAYSVQQTSDSGYIVAGITRGSQTDAANVYLLKTNASGDTLWTRTYGGPAIDCGNSVQQTSDGGYIIAGYTESFGAGKSDLFLIKTNASGDTLWTRAYGGPGEDCGNSIQQTKDSSYIVAGYTYLLGSYAAYLLKVNPQGDTIWSRAFGAACATVANSVQQTMDGGFIIAGMYHTNMAENYDVYLIKTDSLGNVGVAEPLTGHPLWPTRFLVRPNPFTSFARVPGHEADVFALSDVTGRQVAVCKGDRIGQGLRPGVYFLSPAGPRAGNATTATIVKTAF